MTTQSHWIEFDGHRLAYRVAGSGPALVVLNGYRRRADLVQMRVLSDRWRVFQIDPIGYGYSDRVPGYADEALTGHVLSVLDRYDVDRFIIWGYSQRGAMAACIARSTTRAAAMVSGGFVIIGSPTPGQVRRLERELRPGDPSRPFWRYFVSFDWEAELAAMRPPKLVYCGTEDNGDQGRRIRRHRERLEDLGVDVLMFEGLDHLTCGYGVDDSLAQIDMVIPAIVTWIERRVGATW
jgi:pimeloyl-ACP methyl ester carboxylesterase